MREIEFEMGDKVAPVEAAHTAKIQYLIVKWVAEYGEETAGGSTEPSGDEK